MKGGIATGVAKLKQLYLNGVEFTSDMLDLVRYTTASYTEINNMCDLSGRIYNLTAAGPIALSSADDSEVITLNKADGQAITLPAATGSGIRFQLIVGTTITSVGTTIKCVGNDIMKGTAVLLADGGDTVVAFATAADSDTITMDGSATGGIAGACIELIDIAADTWFVKMISDASGSEATPFSATVTP